MGNEYSKSTDCYYLTDEEIYYLSIFDRLHRRTCNNNALKNALRRASLWDSLRKLINTAIENTRNKYDK